MGESPPAVRHERNRQQRLGVRPLHTLPSLREVACKDAQQRIWLLRSLETRIVCQSGVEGDDKTYTPHMKAVALPLNRFPQHAASDTMLIEEPASALTGETCPFVDFPCGAGICVTHCKWVCVLGCPHGKPIMHEHIPIGVSRRSVG